jgi:hypothetical protein
MGILAEVDAVSLGKCCEPGPEQAVISRWKPLGLHEVGNPIIQAFCEID